MNSQAVSGPYANAPKNSKTVLVVALCIGALTAIVSTFYLITERQKLAAQVITVYKVSKDIKAGGKIKYPTDLIATSIPDYLRNSLPVQPIDSKDAKAQCEQKLTRDVRGQELLTLDMFISHSDAIDSKIDKEARGVPLPINSRSASGIIRPGMFVDILATFTDPNKKNPVTLMVMEHVKVIAVGGATEEDTRTRAVTSYSNITVELKPEDARGMLTVSKFVGKDGFDILLRNKEDDNFSYEHINEEVRKLIGLD